VTADAWFEFKIEGASLDDGVDAAALSNTIRDLVSALRVNASVRLNLPERRGPANAAERALSAVRITGLRSSSIVIECAPPKPIQHQPSLLKHEVDPTIVATDLVADLALASERGIDAVSSQRRRQALARLLQSSGKLGTRARATIRAEGVEPVEAAIDLEHVIERELATVSNEIRLVTLIGHIYMVDVESGRVRMRIKLPDETDVTVSAQEELADRMPTFVGQLASVQISEVWAGDTLLERTAVDAEVIETSVHRPLRPKRSLLDLAREQGLLLADIPDYGTLADELWPTETEVEKFISHVADLRVAAL